jgi:hypothetical protein
MFKKTYLLIVILATATLALVGPAWPGTLPASIIPDGARWVAHLDMEKFVATKLFEYLDKDGRIQISDRDITRMLKIDFFKDITGLTVFGLDRGRDEGRNSGAVFAVAGKFDKKRLLTLLSLDDNHQEIPYGANTIYSMGENDKFGAFVNDGLIVFSETREAVEKVLDTAAGKKSNFASSKLSAALKNIPASAFVSGVVEDLAGLGRTIKQSKFVENAKMTFFLAQEKQDNLQVRLQAEADSAENAKNMAEIAQGLIAMFKLNQSEERSAAASSILKGLRVTLEGSIVRLELDMPSRDAANLMSHGRGFDGFLN